MIFNTKPHSLPYLGAVGQETALASLPPVQLDLALEAEKPFDSIASL